MLHLLNAVIDAVQKLWILLTSRQFLFVLAVNQTEFKLNCLPHNEWQLQIQLGSSSLFGLFEVGLVYTKFGDHPEI